MDNQLHAFSLVFDETEQSAALVFDRSELLVQLGVYAKRSEELVECFVEAFGPVNDYLFFKEYQVGRVLQLQDLVFECF